ncbi:hypothetical protein BGZ70_009034 [Mortierella alpina]|uniref:Uncharacterized protein n=1 Tax=Mortierella alpina TaxID=64518 RepID=A0A9P6JDS9_MORAP|nr:hypothetical protein BGZ70_009034 [Mortierella alpina]
MGITRLAHTRSGKPLPFILTVFPVVFYSALIALGYYVYVVTLCVRLIQEGEKALGGMNNNTNLRYAGDPRTMNLQAAPTVQPIHAPQPQSQQQSGPEEAAQFQLSHQGTTSHTLEPHIQQSSLSGHTIAEFASDAS